MRKLILKLPQQSHEDTDTGRKDLPRASWFFNPARHSLERGSPSLERPALLLLSGEQILEPQFGHGKHVGPE